MSPIIANFPRPTIKTLPKLWASPCLTSFEQFQYLKTCSDSPIADLGCGTGIVGEALGASSGPVDGMDISKEMLNAAAGKDVYRDLLQVDLTKSVTPHQDIYGAVLSSGTFTHGHLGPEAIDMAMLLGKAGCLFVLSINQQHFQTMGFDAKFETLQHTNAIHNFITTEVDIYTKQDHDHSGDKALIVSFRKNA